MGRNLHNKAELDNTPYAASPLFLASPHVLEKNRAFSLEYKSGGGLESNPRAISQRARSPLSPPTALQFGKEISKLFLLNRHHGSPGNFCSDHLN